jgi:hypothetical protein
MVPCWSRTVALSTCVAWSCLHAGDVMAEERATNPALAHDLFDQGRALMEKKDYARACNKFEESRQLDPGRGGGTLLNLALCRELAGETGTAWALFRAARSVAIQDRREDRQAFAEQHIAALGPKLLRLRVIVPQEARVPGLLVRRNGVPLGEGEWGEALVVDPGVVLIEVEAPGKRPERLTVRLDEGAGSKEVTVPALTDIRANADADLQAQAARAAGRPQRVAGIITGGVGLAALAVSGILGLRAVNRQNEADRLCPDYDHCDPRGLEASSEAASDARASTVFAVAGALAVVGGVVVFLTAPTSPKAKVSAPGQGRAPAWALSFRF